ncbi:MULTISPECIES: FAD-dependent oxidoreductase [Micromonospora]|uniref:3-(3-hydroxy-phenyl)propionate hydroxylase n=1 Tax=Micromonospora yangpuensis TaxID=683228 RepID=A0A1C6UWE2_9ACTN|nr:FAD-dependent monooxygenase [Micromonospora yangpuensis]GGM25782.1 pentachlorophenol monooxygenase [Micromonospora yangpuensis]SCL58149.1 3-(3-hydroxy-phenyl)propionate hydroxylase [Micromonospora yangpuensis]
MTSATDHPSVLQRPLSPDTVVVLGLGPVGSVAALALAQRGIPVLALEAAHEQYADPLESRASTFHPPTLEMLDELGVTEELLDTGLRAPRYQYRDRRAGVVADFDLAVLAEETRYPFRLQSEQSNLVRIIRERLLQIPHVQVVVGADVVGVRPLPDGIGLSVRTGEDVHLVDAPWVLAADGANSVARRDLDIGFDGTTYEERFLVASTTTELADLLPDLAYVNYVSDPQEWLVLLRTPRHWRVLFPIPDGTDLDQARDPADVARRLQDVAAHPPGYDVTHTTLYNVHQRVAATFRAGHLLLAGDAAHINNPLGGMGMNSGIHDAIAAVRALHDTIGGAADSLDEYATTRRHVAMTYIQQATHRNWQLMQERDPAVRQQHHDKLRRTAADPVAAREYLRDAAMLTSFRATLPTGSPGPR